ncbi:MAG: Fumarate reductase flavoprotein subunit [Candidatus Accumulibacter sp. BA-94]|nr:MAG: Fumarate reductase flavoprotein subunit [Candidatus Accumulibacter sp. BA-94]
MELGPRDRLSQAFWYEQQKGRTIEGPHGSVVHLDLRHLGERKLRERLPQIYELAEQFMGVDPAHAPIPVRPAVHYTMGGILVDGRCAAPLPGLFAAGECSSVGIHGANRLGSNSLSELLVFGKVAGVEAARHARAVAAGDSGRLLKQAQAVEQRVQGLKTKSGGSERIATLRKEMAQTMEDGCGIYRLADTMRKTCDKLDELKDRFRNVNLEDKSSVWNTEWLLAIELEYQLDVAQSMACSAISRRESRGAHQRLDGFEQRDDVNFLAHSQAHYVAGGPPRIDYGPVRITKSQPGTRAYGAAGEKAEQERKASNV